MSCTVPSLLHIWLYCQNTFSPHLTWPTWSYSPCRTPPVSGISHKTPPLVPGTSPLSIAALHPDSKHPSLEVLFWLCSSIIAASSVHYSPLTFPLQPRTTLYTLRHPIGKRGRPTTLLSLLGWPIPHIQQGKADIYLYGYIHFIAI